MAPSNAPFSTDDVVDATTSDETYGELYARLRWQGRDDAQIAAFLGISLEVLREVFPTEPE